MKKIGSFTLAEILISLTIIGIIAALTLPALMANLNEKVWNTKRKALHSRMAQALAAMPNLDKYPETEDNNFIQNGLATTLNITKICYDGEMAKCDMEENITTLADDNIDYEGWGYMPAFSTINGESLALFYNPDCRGESTADFMTFDNMYSLICAHFIYDLNGASKGPNKIGKDMGIIAAFFSEYPLVVAPMPVAATENEVSANEAEDFLASNPDFRLPSLAEAVSLSLFYNYYIDSDSEAGINIWTDNGIICNFDTCGRAGTDNVPESAFLVLVSKNGDAPKTFKILEGNEGGGNPSDYSSQSSCEGAGHFWCDGGSGSCMSQADAANGLCSR